MDLSHLSTEELQSKINDSTVYLEQFLDRDPETDAERYQIADGIESGLSALAALLPTATEAQLDMLERLLKEQGLL